MRPAYQFRSLLALAVFTLSLVSVALNAQQPSAPGTINGRVVDASGKALEAVKVSIAELRIETTTDADGSFTLRNLPEGSYTLLVRTSGARGIAVEHVRPGTTLLPLTLSTSAVRVDPVTITATRTPSLTGSSVLPVSQISEDRLRREATISLAHSLAHLPGVRSVSTGEQIGKPMIRGFYGSRVLVMQDGSRLEDYSWSDEDAPSVDARLAQRVEVIRGPASVLFGSDALGGVVNVVPLDLPTTAGGSFRRFGGELYGASNNKEAGASLTAEGANGKLGWRATGIGRFAESFSTPDGEVENTGFLSVNGEAAAGIRGDRSNTTLRFSHYGGEFKLLEARAPALLAAQEGEEEGPERKLADDRLQLTNDMSFSKARLETKALFQRHSLVEVSDDLCTIQPSLCAGASSGPAERTAFDLLLNTGTLDLLAHHSLSNTIHGVLGASGLYQKNDSRGPLFLVPSATTSSAAAFLFEEATMGRLTLAAGGRIDARKTSADANPALGLTSDRDRDFTEPSGNLGLVFHALAPLSFSANAGLAWRAPTLFELFANGPHLAEGRYEIGDPTLAAERAFNLDGGVRWQSGRVSAEVDAFRDRVKDFAYLTPTSENIQGLRVYRHLQGDALLTGGEGSLEVEVVPSLVLKARHDFVHGNLRRNDEPLPLMPPPRTAIGAEYHVMSAWAGDAFLSAEVEDVARQKRPSPQDFVTPGYTLINFDVGLHPHFFGRNARVDLGIRNAANRRYRNFMSRYKEFSLEPGRNLILRISTE
jgi:outer membrane receptor protein involved in Fe transport